MVASPAPREKKYYKINPKHLKKKKILFSAYLCRRRYFQVLLDYLLWSVPQEDVEIQDAPDGSVGHSWSRLHHELCQTRVHKTSSEHRKF